MFFHHYIITWYWVNHGRWERPPETVYQNYGKVGAFEGAGYVATGMYRPMLDCIMFSKGNKPFCTICGAHIVNIIEQYEE